MADSITRSIEIAAPLERVWVLVSEPGWWINDGEIVAHEITPEAGGDDRVSVRDEVHGVFHVRTVVLEPRRRVVFEWQPGGDGEPATSVEFTLTTAGDSVRLTVVETGFERMSAAQFARDYDDNVEGWAVELAAAKKAF